MIGRHTRWLDLAVKVAETSTYDRYRMGAVIVRGNRVLSLGTNRLQNSPHIAGHHPLCSQHAEEKALSLCGNTRGATMYIGRLTPAGNIGLARPCERCTTQIETSGIKNVYWTGDIP